MAVSSQWRRIRIGRRGAAAAACGLLLLAPACSSSAPSMGNRPQQTSMSPAVASGSDRDGGQPTASLPEGVLASISVGGAFGPTGLAAAGGSLWVQSHLGYEVAQIDPSTNRIVRTVDIGQVSCGLPLAAFDDVLMMPCADGMTSTVVVDGRSGSVRGAIEDAGGGSVTVGAGSVWIPKYDETALKRIDPETLKPQHVINLNSSQVAFDGHFVWSLPRVEEAAGNRIELSKIDPSANRVVASYRIPSMTEPFMTYGFGALWFKAPDTPLLYRFDVSTGNITTTDLDEWEALTEFYDQPPADGEKSIWLRAADGVVVRIDPANGQVVARYAADPLGGGGHPLVAFGSLWVANFGSNSVWREQIRQDG